MPPTRDNKGRFLPKGSQPGSGSGGDVVDLDMGWQAWVRWFEAQGAGAAVEIGIFVPEVAAYAAANEFGTAKIPERSFIRSTFDAQTPALQRLIDQGVSRAQATLTPLVDALIPAANHLRSEIIKTIQSGPPPANAPSTVIQKGYNAPLVNTGQLQRALTWRVSTP